MFNASPVRIDHAIQGIGGPAVKDVLDVVGLGSKGREREAEAGDAPILGRLFQRGGQLGTQPKSIDELYDRAEEASLRQHSKKKPETAEERQLRLMLNDATKNVSALLRVRSETPQAPKRIKITREALDIAIDALDRLESKTLSADRVSNLVYEATGPTAGENRASARRAIKSFGYSQQDLRDALDRHWLNAAQERENTKARKSGRKPQKVLRFARSPAYIARVRELRRMRQLW